MYTWTPEKKGQGSPSSWRAWVEIGIIKVQKGDEPVALLVEGVGRNRSATVSWYAVCLVALLVEGVGRNPLSSLQYTPALRRPPRGGRG